jgi:hypothetical protein
VLPFGRALPIVIDCAPYLVLPVPATGSHATSWTLIQAASAGLADQRREALRKLCQAYWLPVYVFIRRHGFDVEQSGDLTRGFFALLLETNYLLDADLARGNFRSSLLTAAKHFLANESDRANALKRGGGQVPVSIDLSEAEAWRPPAAAATTESLFEHRWALSVLERVIAKLRAEFSESGTSGGFDRLAAFLSKGSESDLYDAAARDFGVSAEALRVLVHQMRRRHRHLLREEIAETVARPEEIDEEIRFLLSVLNVQGTTL